MIQVGTIGHFCCSAPQNGRCSSIVVQRYTSTRGNVTTRGNVGLRQIFVQHQQRRCWCGRVWQHIAMYVNEGRCEGWVVEIDERTITWSWEFSIMLEPHDGKQGGGCGYCGVFLYFRGQGRRLCQTDSHTPMYINTLLNTPRDHHKNTHFLSHQRN